MTRGTWFNTFAAGGGTLDLPAQTREELAGLDNRLFAIWNLGENVLLGWTRSANALLFLSVRHYAIPEFVHAGADGDDWTRDRRQFINAVLSGPKYLKPETFQRVRKTFDCSIAAARVDLPIGNEHLAALVSDMVRCYGVSLVGNRAVMLLD
ncbi:MAG TPA: hypothetical protein VFO57_05070, partial [Burkholderiales bacterium]|nr:hypothetical protein [Burkholderiales bacterium]